MIRQISEDYWITQTGRVYSVKRPKSYSRWLRFVEDKDGYWRVGLWMGGRRTSHIVSRLLATAFIPNPEGKPFVNHRDGDKKNNRLENLEWCTAQENTKHAWINGLCTAYDRTLPYNKQGIIDSNKKRRKTTNP